MHVSRPFATSALLRRFSLPLLYVAAALTFIVSSIMTWHLVSGRSWNLFYSEGLPDNDYGRGPFFSAQAQSLLSGRLSVPPETLYGECFESGGECFGYFGLTPSLLRMPWILAGRVMDLTSVSMVLGISLGIAISLGTFLLIFKRYGPPPETWGWYEVALISLVLLALGPGNLLFQVTDSRIFMESVVWATSLILGAVLSLVMWLSNRKRFWLWLAVVVACLAANARPSAGAAAIGLALVLTIYLWRSATFSLPTLLPVIMLALLPLGTVALSYQLKFNSPVPDLTINESIAGRGPMETRDRWSDVLRSNGGKTLSVDFVLSHAWAALRPDAIGVKWDPPRSAYFARSSDETFTFVPPTPRGGLYVQPTGSLTTLASGPLVFLVAALGAALFRPSLLGARVRVLTGLALGSGLGLGMTWLTVGVANRYLLDAWAMLVLGSSVGVTTLTYLKPVSSAGRWTVVSCLAVATFPGVVLGRLLTGL